MSDQDAEICSGRVRDAVPYLIEETFRIFRPRDTGELDKSDFIAQAIVIVRDLVSIDLGQRYRCRTHVYRKKVATLLIRLVNRGLWRE